MAHQDVDIDLTAIGVRHETPQHLSLIFERPRGFDYEPGDWIELAFEPELRGGPVYSMSSSPSEPDLVITFKVGQSEVKQRLAGARAGERFRFTSYGNDYSFQLNEHRASVLIAGGVGVVPFRSMLKEMADRGSANTVDLVYLNRGADFLFRDELDECQASLPGVTVHYVETRELKRKDREKAMRAAIPNGAARFFIAGPAGMVTSTQSYLTDVLAVSPHDIRLDSFEGY